MVRIALTNLRHFLESLLRVLAVLQEGLVRLAVHAFVARHHTILLGKRSISVTVCLGTSPGRLVHQEFGTHAFRFNEQLGL